MKTQYIRINGDGSKYFFADKKMTTLHREDGPAYEPINGTKAWYINGRCHREDGPAYEWPDGTKAWWLNGRRHREDGPAIECPDGTTEWYINGEQLSEAEFNARKAPKININGKDFTIDQLNALIAAAK